MGKLEVIARERKRAYTWFRKPTGDRAIDVGSRPVTVLTRFPVGVMREHSGV